MFSKPAKPSKEEFNKTVAKNENASLDYNNRAVDVALKFRAAIESTVLAQNKTTNDSLAEKDLIRDIVQLATDMNNDELQEEGIGSVAIISLVLRNLLTQRDRINSIDHKNFLLEAKVAELTSKLEELDKKQK